MGEAERCSRNLYAPSAHLYEEAGCPLPQRTSPALKGEGRGEEEGRKKSIWFVVQLLKLFSRSYGMLVQGEKGERKETRGGEDGGYQS